MSGGKPLEGTTYADDRAAFVEAARAVVQVTEYRQHDIDCPLFVELQRRLEVFEAWIE